MPKVNGKHYPYTAKGMKEAAMAKMMALMPKRKKKAKK